MRILHVANFSLRGRRVFLHSTAVKLSRGWTQSGHHVIDFPIRDLAHWMSPIGIKSIGRKRANQALLKVCKDFSPDIIAFGHADTVSLETLAQIREKFPRIRMFQWNYDWWVNATPDDPGYKSSLRNRNAILSRRPFLDATFITQADAALTDIATDRHRAFYFANPVDSGIETAQNFKSSDLPYDIFFAASSGRDLRHHCGEWREMETFCEDIAKAIPEARLLLPGLRSQPQLFGPDYQCALASCKIGLNISRKNNLYLYSSDRISHMMGNGLAVAIDRASGFTDIFDEDEMIFYSSEDELFAKLKFLQNNDAQRQKIAEKGYNKYYAKFNAAQIARKILEDLET